MEYNRVWELTKEGKTNLYVLKNGQWQLDNNSVIDQDTIVASNYISLCFINRDFKNLDKFIQFIRDNNY